MIQMELLWILLNEVEAEAGPNVIVSGIGLVVGAIGIVVAIVMRIKVRKLMAEKDDEIAQVNAQVKEKYEEFEGVIASLQAQLATANQQNARLQAQLQKEAKSAMKPKILPQEPTTYYLSRPDEQGYFLSASTAVEPGNSIFVLDAPSGKFRVIDDANVHQLALMMPTENLTRACTGHNIQVSAGMSRIVTDADGKAVREGNKWRVMQPATIHYES